jgi:hypothetical protein
MYKNAKRGRHYLSMKHKKVARKSCAGSARVYNMIVMDSQPILPTEDPKLPQQQNEPERVLPAARESSLGTVVGISIIIIVLVAGALYFWGAQLAAKDRNGAESPAEEAR